VSFIDEEPIPYTEFDPVKVDFVKSMDSGDLECRALRHAWDITGECIRMTSGQFSGATVRVLQCNRCESIRLDFLTLRGRVFYRKYLYAEGYTFPDARSVGSLDRELIYAEMMHRAKVAKSIKGLDKLGLPSHMVESIQNELRKH
jgi:hypothetical protein